MTTEHRAPRPAKPAATHAEAAAAQAARDDVPAGMLGVHRWYLRRAPGPFSPPDLGDGRQILTAAPPPLAYYRFLYAAVGENWLWFERRALSDAALAEALAPPAVSVSTLFEAGAPMGFFELNRADPAAVDLAYFGLAPWAIGRGLGLQLLRAAIEAADGATRAMTVNTCTLDHPKALALYQEAGFVIEREVAFEDPDLRLDGLFPETAAAHVPHATR